jgi:hypothetical protein
MLHDLTDEQLEQRLDMVEGLISRCTDHKSLPHHNDMYQQIIDEQVRRDMEKESCDTK